MHVKHGDKHAHPPALPHLTGGEGEDAVGRDEVHGFHSCAKGVSNREAKYFLLRGGGHTVASRVVQRFFLVDKCYEKGTSISFGPKQL